MYKLGIPVTDKATNLQGMLIHMQIQTNGNRFYNFQPKGLSPESGQPLKRLWISPDRILGGIEIPEATLPLNVLGTPVEDIASGFAGQAVALTLHINGCVHIEVQPSGVQPKNGEALAANDFDIRLLKGINVPVLDEAAREESEKRHPSPAECISTSPREL